jgi:DNA-binding XRE family transcriptional regulator
VAVPEGFVDIDEAVTSLEADPVRREGLAKARQRIAQEVGAERRGLAYLRLRQGWSQKTLADAIGTSQSHIARIEAGRGDVLLGTANNLARVLGVSILEINEALGFGEPQT